MEIRDTEENGGEVYKVCPLCDHTHQDACDVCDECMEKLEAACLTGGMCPDCKGSGIATCWDEDDGYSQDLCGKCDGTGKV